jgi:pyrroline-5-carboxylate reductase
MEKESKSVESDTCEPKRTGLFVVGAGSMAEAFIRGVLAEGAVRAEDIFVRYRSNQTRAMQLETTYGIRVTQDVTHAVKARIIVLAVKPMDVSAALTPLLPYLDGQTLVSFAAGVPMATLGALTNGLVGIVRTMPNLPAAVQSGATAMCANHDVSAAELAYVEYLLEQVGCVVSLPESLMDAATAFSGSGPGFVSYFLEAMESAAVQLGFTETVARQLLLHTVMGTAKALIEWELSPAELRQRVTSPNGTTHAGLAVMESHQLAETVLAALRAAAARSAEMGIASQVAAGTSVSHIS